MSLSVWSRSCSPLLSPLYLAPPLPPPSSVPSSHALAHRKPPPWPALPPLISHSSGFLSCYPQPGRSPAEGVDGVGLAHAELETRESCGEAGKVPSAQVLQAMFAVWEQEEAWGCPAGSICPPSSHPLPTLALAQSSSVGEKGSQMFQMFPRAPPPPSPEKGQRIALSFPGRKGL